MSSASPGPAGALFGVLVCLALAPGFAGRADFVGSKRCGTCHEAEYRAWSASPHAETARSLGGAPAPGCLPCHTTGEAPTGPVVERSVGCEACHGPGRGYFQDDVMRDPALSRALGLRDVRSPSARERLCLGCHRVRTKLVPRILEDAWREIGHGALKKASGQ